jgi:hypothetical protein
MSRRRVTWLVILFAVLLSLACIGLGVPSTLPVGESAPGFGVQAGSGTLTLDDLRGNVVVTMFWSST